MKENINSLLDANKLYKAGKLAIKSSSFKYETQNFEMNQLVEIARLQERLFSGNYKPNKTRDFVINERGKVRNVSSNTMADKTVNHVLCDEIIMPQISKYLIYDNCSSQIGKGVSLQRKRIKVHLMKYFREYKTHEGWILQIDFKSFYDSINHKKSKEILYSKVETDELIKLVVDNIYESFKKDEEHSKNGIDIGNQLSQSIGILFPYIIDNYIKIVRGQKYYGRYTDDSYIIANNKELLKDILENVIRIANSLGITVNTKKTRIAKLNVPFYFLKVKYTLQANGKVKVQIHPKTLTRERRKLKAYKRLFDKNKISYEDIENSFKSWLGSFWKMMSAEQIRKITELYKNLFGRVPKWKKKSRLNYLMVHKLNVN